MITYAASRLVASGGELTIRSTSTVVTRTLDIAWLDRLVRSELRGLAAARSGPEKSTAVPAKPIRSEPTHPVHGSRRTTVISAEDDMVDDALV